MTTQSTPGPWKNIDSNRIDSTGVSGGNMIICRMYSGFDISVQNANARLIAASPDLLEALIQAVRHEERNRKVMCEANAHMGFDEPDKLQWVIVAEAAIAKATQP